MPKFKYEFEPDPDGEGIHDAVVNSLYDSVTERLKITDDRMVKSGNTIGHEMGEAIDFGDYVLRKGKYDPTPPEPKKRGKAKPRKGPDRTIEE